jgi:thiosulfate reductase cytochrome b subunit
MSEVKIATGVDRVWHWVHAVGIVLLALSGFHIHFPREFQVFGSLADAIAVHQFVGWVVIADFALWLLYNLFTGRIRFYLPSREDLGRGSFRQLAYYLFGIFRRDPHPYEADGVKRKFNPLQKQGYIVVMFILLPAQIATGLILDQYVKQWATLERAMVREMSIIHTALGYFFVAFIISHIYLATTGHTLFAHFKMMITGKEEIHSEHAGVSTPEA